MIQVRIDYQLWAPEHADCPIEVELMSVLAGIAEHGTVAAAARQANLSSRHAWRLVERWQEWFGRTLVLTERDTGAQLSSFAEQLLAADSQVRNELARKLAEISADLQVKLATACAANPPRLTAWASDDLALPALREILHAQFGVDLDLRFEGSVPSLRALAKGKTDLAGFHYVPSADAADSSLATCRRNLRPRSQRLIEFVTREQGLMLPRGNPKRVTGLSDLGRADLRIINRRPGSETRIELDRLLRERGLIADRIAGYRTEEGTHLAVAASIATGIADAGFGIAAAAARFGLDFIPVQRERYLIACRADMLARPAMQLLIAAMTTPVFRQVIQNLPGYDASDAGRVLAVGELPDPSVELQQIP